jgi:hypothetical protein
MDYCVPQIYWEIGNKAADYDELIHWWDNNIRNTNLYIGEDVERTAKFNQMARKMALHSEMKRVQGTVLWYAKAAVDNVGNYGTQLRNNYWYYPALQPTTPWIDKKAPDKVRKLKAIDVNDQRVLFWTAPKAKKWSDEAVKYVVYRFDKKERVDIDDPSKIVAITENTHFELPDQPHKTQQVYVVTALDRLQNESSIKKIKVKY